MTYRSDPDDRPVSIDHQAWLSSKRAKLAQQLLKATEKNARRQQQHAQARERRQQQLVNDEKLTQSVEPEQLSATPSAPPAAAAPAASAPPAAYTTAGPANLFSGASLPPPYNDNDEAPPSYDDSVRQASGPGSTP